MRLRRHSCGWRGTNHTLHVRSLRRGPIPVSGTPATGGASGGPCASWRTAKSGGIKTGIGSRSDSPELKLGPRRIGGATHPKVDDAFHPPSIQMFLNTSARACNVGACEVAGRS